MVSFDVPTTIHHSTLHDEDRKITVSERGITAVRHAMSVGFEALQKSSQTLEERREMHRKYQAAIRGLRSELAQGTSCDALLESVWLFAMYEVSDQCIDMAP